MQKHFWLKLTLIFLCGGAISMSIYLMQPKFGKLPAGTRLERLQASPNYAGGEFRNQIPTPMFAEESSRLGSLWNYLFAPKERLKPDRPLPMLKTDLAGLDRNRDAVIWLGHSSLFAQLNGNRILIDPVFSSEAAPFPFMNRAFAGEYPYTADDLPTIDYLIISHDHWDHLDYPTLNALRSKIKTIVCPLGVGAHLEHWGFSPAIIHEADWHTALRLDPEFTIHVLPARHFSGRWLSGNKTLWAGFLLETPQRKIFYSGDSGYGPHFAEIGAAFGAIDLAIMENGQYDPSWKYIHMMPEEAAQGAEDLRAKALLPVHAGRFSITNHAWDDPYKRILAAGRDKNFKLLTPKLGEAAYLDESDQTFSAWWETAELAQNE